MTTTQILYLGEGTAMSGTQDALSSKLGQIISHIEETIIATLLGLMVLVTFANVVLRYGFGLSLLWGLEVTLILFAWLVLFGISYGFKITAHLGVDAILNMAGTRVRKGMVIFSALMCVAYGGLMMKGAWDYWAPFAGFQQTTGRIIPTGFDEKTRDQGWYETDFVPIPFAQTYLENTFNMGEEYEKLPRFVPYFMLPFGVALMLLRIIQATIAVARGLRPSMIVSHEAEEAVQEVAHMNKDA
jgi:C4-dicarboxylate transporter DctQ subunit